MSQPNYDRDMLISALTRARNALSFAVSLLQAADLDDLAEKLEPYITEADSVLDAVGSTLSRN